MVCAERRRTVTPIIVKKGVGLPYRNKMFAVELISAARVLLLAQQVGICMYPLHSRWAGAVSVTVERESAKTKRSVLIPL